MEESDQSSLLEKHFGNHAEDGFEKSEGRKREMSQEALEERNGETQGL